MKQDYSEEQLAEQLKDNRLRKQAFELIVNKFSERLYWQIRRMVISHEDANDILQNTFIKAWTNLNYFRGDAKLSTWLYRIAINESLTFLKQQKKKQGISLDDIDTSLVNKLKASQYFDGDELEKKFHKAILQLPDKQRLIFNLKYFNHLKYEEISQLLDTSVGSLKASYHHAVKKVKIYFREED